MNGRLDTIQAAVLIEKLKIFPDEIEARDRVAERYNELLGDVATVPQVPHGFGSVWAQYTIRLAPGKRDPLAAALRSAGHSDRASTIPSRCTGRPPIGTIRWPTAGCR